MQNTGTVEKWIKPQPGFQHKFISSPAEVAIGGGAAGCGKTFGLLFIPFWMLPRNDNVQATIFRKQHKQIIATGGIWDSSVQLFSILSDDYRPRILLGDHEYRFKNGSRLKFDHLSNPDTHLGYQGAEIAMIGFDELTHFSKAQFFYMLSRNRSTAVRIPFTRCTTNPQGDGWVKDMVSWYLYPEDHKDETKADYPIPERSGVIRYFTSFEDEQIWGATRQEVLDKLPKSVLSEYDKSLIKSFTFIPGLLEDNQILEKANPQYRASLMALSATDRAQLLGGRWRNIDNDKDPLFEHSAIVDLFSNTFVSPTGKRYLTTDIALEGRDRFIIVVWDGWVILKIYEYSKTDGLDVLNIIREMANRWRVPYRNIAFDAAGVGGYLKGFLKTAFSFFGQAAPMIEDHIRDAKKQGMDKPKYKNLRTQCYYYLARKMNDCEIYASNCTDHQKVMIGEEFRATKKAPTGPDGKLRILAKDEISAIIKRSPDYADTISMRAVFDFKPTVKGRKVQVSHTA